MGKGLDKRRKEDLIKEIEDSFEKMREVGQEELEANLELEKEAEESVKAKNLQF